MQQKKPRTPGSESARRQAKSAGATRADTAAAAEPMSGSGERQEMPGSARDEAIRTRAYYLFLERGARGGHELDDWLRAEREDRP